MDTAVAKYPELRALAQAGYQLTARHVTAERDADAVLAQWRASGWQVTSAELVASTGEVIARHVDGEWRVL